MPIKQHTYTAPAKINLTLDVLDRRPDGYHDLRSIFQSVSLADRVVVALGGGGADSLSVTGPEAAGIPEDRSNIVLRAAAKMTEEAAKNGRRAPAVSIRLIKNIPARAGLGGGSSDAAAVILSLNELLGLEYSREELVPIAAQLGADVPYFLYGGQCRVEGIGERVEPLGRLGDYHVTLVKPHVGVDTAEAYRLLDEMTDRRPGASTERWLERPQGRLPLHNDFEQVVFGRWPQIGEAHAAISEAAARRGAYPPRLCGSGACLFTLCATAEQNDHVTKDLAHASIGKIWQARTITGGCTRVD